MKAKALHCIAVLVILAAIVCGGTAWALDEAILTPTNDSRGGADEREFNSAMAIWYSHRYSDGKTLLGEFAKKYPNSRWRAEAELHVGCYLTFDEQYAAAKQIFSRLASEFKDTNIREKATARLGNIAEREGRWDDAIGYYSSMLKMSPTWDQFKYANYRARKLYMTRNALQAKINCGPVALAACLDALGKTSEATTARAMESTVEGVSLFALANEAGKLGVTAQSIELPFADLKTSSLPVLAHVQPNHYVAVLSVDGETATIEDSIQGKREVALATLEQKWTGRALAFNATSHVTLLSMVDALQTTGGCCGKADEDECLGCPSDCKQSSSSGTSGSSGSGGGGSGGGSGGGMMMMGGPECETCGGGPGGGGGNNGGSTCCSISPARPTWKVNTINLNILVNDTPIWYDPGKGYSIAFTLSYSNENSNTGIFGRGWRCLYDMRLFVLTNDALQVHLDTGRIETYEWSGTVYVPRGGYAAYGYLNQIKVLTAAEATAEGVSNSPGGEGTYMYTRRDGSKYFFMKAGSGETVECRIYIIQDPMGNRVTCTYTNGALASVTDANNAVTTIATTGTGINERVTDITLPTGDGRTAAFDYDTVGNLISITDMIGDTSKLYYNALLPSSGASQFSASTTTTQAITTSDPATSNGTLSVNSTTDFSQVEKSRLTTMRRCPTRVRQRTLLPA